MERRLFRPSLRRDEASTTFGSITEPPSATARIAATSWSRSRPVLQQVRPPGHPGLEQGQCVARLRILAEDDDRSGWSPSDGGGLNPSSAPIGGIRMSVTSTSDDSSLDGREEVIEIAAGSDDLQVGVGLEATADAFAKQVVIFRDGRCGSAGAARHRSRLRIWSPKSGTLIGFSR